MSEQAKREHPANWRQAICPVHGFTVVHDHNLGYGRCAIPGCGRWHEFRDFFPASLIKGERCGGHGSRFLGSTHPGCPDCQPSLIKEENDLVRQDVAEDHRRAWDAEVERASGENDETMTTQRKAE